MSCVCSLCQCVCVCVCVCVFQCVPSVATRVVAKISTCPFIFGESVVYSAREKISVAPADGSGEPPWAAPTARPSRGRHSLLPGRGGPQYSIEQ